MNKLILPFFGLISLLFFCCSDNDDPSPGFTVEEVNGKFLVSKEEHVAVSSMGGHVTFVYDNNGRLIKRKGGLIYIPTATGYSALYSRGIYDTIEYIPGGIRLISKDTLPDIDIQPYQREIILAGGLPQRKITASNLATGSDADTIYYFYSHGHIERSEQRFKSSILTKEYFFNEQGNLTKITGTKRSRYDNAIIGTTEEIFGGYDDKPNRLKGLLWWEDLYHRGLSNNNYILYIYTTASGGASWTWTLFYDSEGNIDYSK